MVDSKADITVITLLKTQAALMSTHIQNIELKIPRVKR